MRDKVLLLFVVLASVVVNCPLAHAQETPAAYRIAEPALDSKFLVERTFYDGPFNWIWQAGGLGVLSMRGHAVTQNGGTVERVTACLFSESNFTRRFVATVSVRQGNSTIQSIEFSRNFPSLQFTCHTLSGFDAEVDPGEFEVVVSYDKFDADNLFAGLASTDAGQVFDVQIGSSRPPYATGPQGPILIRGIGISYLIDENEAPPPPPPACIPDAYTACLLNGRFKVTVNWERATDSGRAKVMHFDGQRAETDQSVFMWFFNDRNFEMGIKMVNACVDPYNHFWAFVSGLTNQGFVVTIEDTETDTVWTHENVRGEFPLTRGDTEAFDCP